MAEKINEDLLSGEWIHSSEEDTDDETVFRPSSYDFPLKRGPRETFQLDKDGTLKKGLPTASDSLDVSDGSWKLENEKIAFYSNARLIQKQSIVSVDKDKLVLKKL